MPWATAQVRITSIGAGSVWPGAGPRRRRDVVDQLLIGGARRDTQAPAASWSGRSEENISRNRAGMRHREIDIAHARRHQLRQRIGLAAFCWRDFCWSTKRRKPFGRQRGQQAVHVAKMVRRRGVADARALGHTAQREALDAALGQLGLAGLQQDRAQVAVVIGTAGAALDSVEWRTCSPLSPRSSHCQILS